MALRVEVISRELFKYLPAKVLLMPCSLVNKFWNKEARTFIRDYRNCRIGTWMLSSNILGSALRDYDSDSKWEGSVPQILQEDDNICETIIEGGRGIPFNYMRLPEETYGNCGNACKYDKIVLKNLIGGFQLKYLEIGVLQVNFHCAYRDSLRC